jgi:hypothetical protein
VIGQLLYGQGVSGMQDGGLPFFQNAGQKSCGN